MGISGIKMPPMKKNEKRFLVGVIAFIVISCGIIAVCEASAADLPQYADLSFRDQTDLNGQVDSVLAVCHQDSTYYLVDFYGSPDWIYFPVCRRFAGLTVFDNARWVMTSGSASFVIGQAHLWWWEEEE